MIKKFYLLLVFGKSGTTFMVNNLAFSLSSMGINVGVLDTTKNKDTYYIYTKNEESLRKIAYDSTKRLQNGIADGIKLNKNLTVYTGLPGEEDFHKNIEPIIETLLKKHDFILLDSDLTTPQEFFSYANTVFIVQSMDILSIQSLTEFLAKLENERFLDDSKIKVIINKYLKLDSITEREILIGLSYYSDPKMTYLKKIFDIGSTEYEIIPFYEEVYRKYLDMIIQCDIKTENYPQDFIERLKSLATDIYSE